MTYQNDSQGGSRGGFGGGFRSQGPRPMIDVTSMNITCCDCSTPITQLPFNPDPNRLNTIRCRDCLRKSRPPRY